MAFLAGGALVAGVAAFSGRLHWPIDSPVLPVVRGPASGGQPAPQRVGPQPAGPVFAAISGVGCPPGSDRGTAVVNPGSSAQLGGWVGAGCRGTFHAIPMSGKPAIDQPDRFVLWWFTTGQVDRGDCAIFVYVPRGVRELDVAGKPTTYQVTRGRDDPTPIGTFTIDQTVHRGRWVDGGVFELTNGEIAVRMLNRGANPRDERHGAAQVKVDCWPG
jgi:hypothetical protein